MQSYATPAELAAYMDPDAEEPAVPALASVLLRHATTLVLDAISALRYNVVPAPADDAGHPALPAYLAAVQEATMEQASAWSLHGIDPRLGRSQLARRVKSKTLGNGSVSVTYEDGSPELLALADGDQLTSAAWRILDNAGMISNRVSTGGAPERFNVTQRYYDPTTGELEA